MGCGVLYRWAILISALMFRVLVLVLSSAVGLFGQAEVLTIDQAVKEAVDKNLNLLAERFNIPVADARIAQARLRPNPVLSLGLDYLDILGTGFNLENAAGPSEGNARIDYVLERGGKRERRVEVAEAAKSVAQLNLLNTTRQLVYDVESAFVDVLLAQESLALARENLKSFNAIVDVNSTRVRAGDLAKVELIRSQLAALQFRNAVRQAELRVRAARNRLQLLIGRPAMPDTVTIGGPPRRDTAPVAIDLIRETSLRMRPDLLALERDQARSTAELRLQLAQGKVDWTVGSQYHRQYSNAMGNSVGFFFSMPLPVYNRNQGEIERARREMQQIETRIKALQQSIANEVEAVYQQYETSRTLLENIERDMLKEAREVRDATEYSYRRGEASFVEFLDAQRAFNDTMQSYNEARAEFARNLYLIDSVTGKVVNP